MLNVRKIQSITLLLTLKCQMPTESFPIVQRTLKPWRYDVQSVAVKREGTFLFGANPFDIPCPVNLGSPVVALDAIQTPKRTTHTNRSATYSTGHMPKHDPVLLGNLYLCSAPR